MPEVKDKMIEVVNRIPRQSVSSFGEIAKIVQEELDRPVSAQVIGWLLSGLPEHDWTQLPWWRVVAKTGYVSSLKLWDKWWRQIELLRQEQIPVENNTVDMEIWAVWATDLRE